MEITSHLVHVLELVDHLGVIVVVPLGLVDALLHLLQGLLQHLGELRRHLLDFLLQLVDLSLLVPEPFLLLPPGLRYYLVVSF